MNLHATARGHDPAYLAENWPRCRASVPTDFGYELVTGRIVGRTTEGAPRYDVRDDDGRLHLNIPAARVREE